MIQDSGLLSEYYSRVSNDTIFNSTYTHLQHSSEVRELLVFNSVHAVFSDKGNSWKSQSSKNAFGKKGTKTIGRQASYKLVTYAAFLDKKIRLCHN